MWRARVTVLVVAGMLAACGKSTADPQGIAGSAGVSEGGAPAGSGAQSGSGGGGGEAGVPLQCPPDGTPTPNVTVDDVCGAIVPLGCFLLTEETCRNEYEETAGMYQGTCCEPLFATAMACALEHGFYCPTYATWIMLDPACDELQEAYQLCAGSGDDCETSTGGETGHLDCDTYGASCSALTIPQPCSCRRGPNVGTTFTLDAITPFETLVARHCK